MATFDWLSDLQPLFSAHETWLEGTYSRTEQKQLICPPGQAFYIASGAGLLAEHIRRFRFSPEVVNRLGHVTDKQGRSVFSESFLNHLQRMRLRTQVNAAPEGTLLFPGEPLLTLQGTELQLRLLDSAIQLLIWESTYWTTISAMKQWEKGVYAEEETPMPAPFPFHSKGWKMRAKYIGGDYENALDDATTPAAWPGYSEMESGPGQPIVQIRRLFKGEHPLGDVWLNAEQDAHASVSHSHLRFMDSQSGRETEVQMSRFQNLLQPVLVKGHPAFNSPSVDYLRQRMWKQLEAFRNVDLGGYARGWFVGI